MARPRKPTSQMKRSGAFKHNPNRSRPAEPSANPKEPTCPKWMTGIARQEWNRTTDQLRILGILSASDQSMLEVYCVTFAEWRTAIKEAGSGLRYVNQLKQLQREFGLSPSSRSSINLVLAADESQNPFVQLAKINNAEGER